MKFFCVFIFLTMGLVFAENVDTLKAIESTTSSQNVENCNSYQEELNMRDSLMSISDSLCKMEKDSLRNSLAIENAKCKNWEESYNTMKQSNEACAKALSISIGVNEKSKENRDRDRKEAAMMTSTSFLGGLGIGMLLFWLIFD